MTLVGTFRNTHAYGHTFDNVGQYLRDAQEEWTRERPGFMPLNVIALH